MVILQSSHSYKHIKAHVSKKVFCYKPRTYQIIYRSDSVQKITAARKANPNCMPSITCADFVNMSGYQGSW